MRAFRRLSCLCGVLILAYASARAGFRDDFDAPIVREPDGKAGWNFFTGDGDAVMDFTADAGIASVRVDSTADRRNIWWALIKRDVTTSLDLASVAAGRKELRVEARVRTQQAPRRINLHLNTSRTTDFHSQLLEFDLAEPDTWYTVSMTTRGFPAQAGDTVYAQLALMDWGIGHYQVDLDYFRVDAVDPQTAPPDQGDGTPYHPPVRPVSSLTEAVRVAQDSTVDTREPDANLSDWSVADGRRTTQLLGVSGTNYAVLRWDLARYAGHTVDGAGVLELTTHSVQRRAKRTKDFGLVRVVEILGGAPDWTAPTVTYSTLTQGLPYEKVFNTQMVIDQEIAEPAGAKTLISISRPVLQRLIDGRTKGLVLIPLGSIHAALLSSREGDGSAAPVLRFSLK